MTARIFLAFIFMASFVSTVYGEHILEDAILAQLYSHHDLSIKEVHDEKYYLNPEKVLISDEGLYLCSDHFGPLLMQHLFQDNQGMFVMAGYYQYQCNRCSKIFNSKPSACDRCGGTSFSPYGID